MKIKDVTLFSRPMFSDKKHATTQCSTNAVTARITSLTCVDIRF